MAFFAFGKVAGALLCLCGTPIAMKTDSSMTRLTSNLKSKLSISMMNSLKLANGVLSPYNLKGIEASLLALGAQSSKRDRSENSDLNEFLVQIADLINQMKLQIKDQQTSSQQSLNNAVSDISKCSLNATTSSIAWWSTLHMDCRNSESGMGTLYNDCLVGLAQHDQIVHTRYVTFQEMSSYPNSCAYEPASTASIGTSDRRRSNRDYLIGLRDAFQQRSTSWTSAYQALLSAEAARNSTRADCVTKLYSYRKETERCNAIQNDLEIHACGSSQSCDDYMDCYRCKHDQWLKTNTTVASAEVSWLAQWEGTLRIECLIAKINSTSTFNASVCDTDYSGSLSDEVRISYESPNNIPGLISCNATSAKIPGSAGFIDTYYASMPAHTQPAPCKAACCVYREGCCYNFKYESNLACCLETANSDLANCTSQSGYGYTVGWVNSSCPKDADMAHAMVASAPSLATI